jgi:hypothetical protein
MHIRKPTVSQNGSERIAKRTLEMNVFTDQMSDAITNGRPYIVRSALVRRLIQAHEDGAKVVVRQRLLQCSDEQLKTGLGLTDEDIRALRNDWQC